MNLAQDDLEKVSVAFASETGDGWQRAACPLCLDRTGKVDGKQSMGLNTDTGGFVCHKCGVTGLLTGYESAIDFNPCPEEVEKEEPTVAFCDGYLSLGEGPGCDALSTQAAHDYLRRRKVYIHNVAIAQIGVVLEGWLAGRIVIPHILPEASNKELRNPWSGWIARDYVHEKPSLPYRYSTGLSRDRLWNEVALGKDLSPEPILLVEGVFDALPYYPDVCAFLGKPTAAHVEILGKHRGRPIVVALDGDSWEEGWALTQKLKMLGAPAFHVKLPAGEDPGSVHPDWLRQEAKKL